MKLSFMRGLLTAGLCTSLSIISVHAAIPFQIPATGADIPKNGTGPITDPNGNSPADDFFRLVNVVNLYNSQHPGAPLPTPDFTTGFQTIDDPVVSSPGLSPWTYAVLHYGVGNGGNQMSGGGIEVFFLNGASGFSFPNDGTGPNGFGGFSGGVLYQAMTSTPEPGTTGALSALVVGILAIGSHFRRAKAS